MKAAITTHVLDLQRGLPASGITVELIAPEQQTFRTKGCTDDDGRIGQWANSFELVTGVWTLRFETGTWFDSLGESSFFAHVTLAFKIEDLEQHYHVPLLLNRFGYSTYRGS